jgi:hypothetical protein
MLFQNDTILIHRYAQRNQQDFRLRRKQNDASFQEAMPVYYPSPNVSRPAAQLTEEEQVKIAKRIGLIQHLPTGTYDGCKKNRE